MLTFLTPLMAPRDAGVPNPKPQAPDGIDTKVNLLLGIGMYVVIAACVAGVFIVAGRMAVAHRRGELGESASGLVAVGAACILAGSAAAFVKFLLG